MLHAAIRAAEGTLLFRDWTEARELWTRLATAIRLFAATLMPQHLHTTLRDAAEQHALAVALRGYALWRNARRGESGDVFEHRAEPTVVTDRRHAERTRRYIHLNPCREGLARDPLAWPFSTHRDALGLAWPAVCGRVQDPERFHAYVSADPCVAVKGTALPANSEPATISEVLAAVSAITRTPVGDLVRRGPERRLLIGAARRLTEASTREIEEAFAVGHATVFRASAPDAFVRMVRRVVRDPRFAGLPDGDLRRDPAWRAYRRLR